MLNHEKKARRAVSGGNEPVGACGFIRSEEVIGLVVTVQRQPQGRTHGEGINTQDTQKTRQMGVIVTRIGIGAGAVLEGMVLTALRIIGECINDDQVFVTVMAEVLGGLTLLVSAIVGHRRPGDLER